MAALTEKKAAPVDTAIIAVEKAAHTYIYTPALQL